MKVSKSNSWFTTRAAILRLFCLFFLLALSAKGVERHILSGHVPWTVAHLQPMGRLLATNVLRLAITLPLRNQDALANLLQRLYDPASPDYHCYLTPEQFAEKFGPTVQDYQTVLNFARSNGLAVTATHDSRMLLDVRGNALDIERAFQVTLRNYQHPTEPRQFYAPDVEPSVEAGLPLLEVTGLSDYARPLSMLRKKPAGAHAVPEGGTAPDRVSYLGSDFRNAYAPGVSLSGSGQMIGLLELDGYYTSDITAYETLAQTGLPNVPLINVLIDGFNGTPGLGDDEVSLDIEMAIAMAPGLAAVVVFEAPTNDFVQSFIDIVDSMASSNQIKQFSSSWGYTGPGPNASMDQYFQKMACHGQSFFQASGDGDGWVNPIMVPADSPYLTSVGGTTLSARRLEIRKPWGWISETVWNWDVEYAPTNYDTGSGGGISTIYSIPTWQQGISMSANDGSTMMRNIPDVALTADHVWITYGNGQSEWVGGTSCAAPLWAALIALANQQAAANGHAPMGFINPAIYAIGQGPDYSSCFHDITTGNNTWSGSPSEYYAVPGYDLCTGWGTPAGQSLIDALSPPAFSVVSYWRMGENDVGATAGATGTNETDCVGSDTLTFSGQALHSSDVAATALAHTGSILSVNFSGFGGYATGNLVSAAQDNFGVEAWVKPASVTSDQTIVYNGGTATSGWGLRIDGSSSTYTALFGGVDYFGASPATPNVWTHVALARNNGVATLYVNGIAAGTTSLSPNRPTGNFAIGAPPQNPASQPFIGSVDEVRVFTFPSGQFTTNDLLLNQPEVIVKPPTLTGIQMLGNGVLQFAFSNTSSASFTVLSTTNLSLPLKNWAIVGSPTNIAPGLFQFTTEPTTNDPQCFYRIISP